MTAKDFHSKHPKPTQEGYVAIAWAAPIKRARSVRIRSHTCECAPIVYELCATGGLGHIRRTERTPDGKDGKSVSESPWLRAVATNELWTDLLGGRAR